MNIENIDRLFRKYKSKGLMIDTNILLVYFVGLYSPEAVGNLKRTKEYNLNDFYTIFRIIEYFKQVITTPNILTELSNLSKRYPDEFKTIFSENVKNVKELYLESFIASSKDHFKIVGLTDSALIELSKNNYLIITNDLPLFHYLQNVNVDAINYNHIRMAGW